MVIASIFLLTGSSTHLYTDEKQTYIECEWSLLLIYLFPTSPSLPSQPLYLSPSLPSQPPYPSHSLDISPPNLPTSLTHSISSLPTSLPLSLTQSLPSQPSYLSHSLNLFPPNLPTAPTHLISPSLSLPPSLSPSLPPSSPLSLPTPDLIMLYRLIMNLCRAVLSPLTLISVLIAADSDDSNLPAGRSAIGAHVHASARQSPECTCLVPVAVIDSPSDRYDCPFQPMGKFGLQRTSGLINCEIT